MITNGTGEAVIPDADSVIAKVILIRAKGKAKNWGAGTEKPGPHHKKKK